MAKKQTKRKSGNGETDIVLLMAKVDDLLEAQDVSNYEVVTVADRLLVSVFGNMADSQPDKRMSLMMFADDVVKQIYDHIEERIWEKRPVVPTAEA